MKNTTQNRVKLISEAIGLIWFFIILFLPFSIRTRYNTNVAEIIPEDAQIIDTYTHYLYMDLTDFNILTFMLYIILFLLIVMFLLFLDSNEKKLEGPYYSNSAILIMKIPVILFVMGIFVLAKFHWQSYTEIWDYGQGRESLPFFSLYQLLLLVNHIRSN
ncbi:MAG: hypothetical protein INQ03_17775 [Candidatus Heimdallarchaeota archaeon]|nr:hypothetical protein [Candidatus Heimdallarchaeota archaeon]